MSKRGPDSDHAGGGHDGAGMLRWLLTYADMITLLMAFFIMMYAMSVIDLKKFDELALSVRSGFGGDAKGMGLKDKAQSANLAKPIVPPVTGGDSLANLGDRIRARLQNAGLLDKVAISAEDNLLVIRLMADGLFFDRGSAVLRQDVRTILDAVAAGARDLPNDIRVEGHTCDLPIRTPQFPSNWELSAARAINCVVYLAKVRHISPDRLFAVGYADTRPLAPNTTEGNRVKNRRVDILIVNEEAATLAAGSRGAETAQERSDGR